MLLNKSPSIVIKALFRRCVSLPEIEIGRKKRHSRLDRSTVLSAKVHDAAILFPLRHLVRQQ